MHKTCKFTQYSIIFSVSEKNDHIGGHTLSRYVNGEITLRKLLDNKAETPFSALDVWCDENGYGGEDSLGEALEYVEGIRADRNNKEIPQW